MNKLFILLSCGLMCFSVNADILKPQDKAFMDNLAQHTIVGLISDSEEIAASQEEKQVREFIKKYYYGGENTSIDKLIVEMGSDNAKFLLVKYFAFNQQTTCEKITGNVIFHKMKNDNDSIILIDSVSSHSISCQTYKK